MLAQKGDWFSKGTGLVKPRWVIGVRSNRGSLCAWRRAAIWIARCSPSGTIASSSSSSDYWRLRCNSSSSRPPFLNTFDMATVPSEVGQVQGSAAVPADDDKKMREYQVKLFEALQCVPELQHENKELKHENKELKKRVKTLEDTVERFHQTHDAYGRRITFLERQADSDYKTYLETEADKYPLLLEVKNWVRELPDTLAHLKADYRRQLKKFVAKVNERLLRGSSDQPITISDTSEEEEEGGDEEEDQEEIEEEDEVGVEAGGDEAAEDAQEAARHATIKSKVTTSAAGAKARAKASGLASRFKNFPKRSKKATASLDMTPEPESQPQSKATTTARQPSTAQQRENVVVVSSEDEDRLRSSFSPPPLTLKGPAAREAAAQAAAQSRPSGQTGGQAQPRQPKKPASAPPAKKLRPAWEPQYPLHTGPPQSPQDQPQQPPSRRQAQAQSAKSTPALQRSGSKRGRQQPSSEDELEGSSPPSGSAVASGSKLQSVRQRTSGLFKKQLADPTT